MVRGVVGDSANGRDCTSTHGWGKKRAVFDWSLHIWVQGGLAKGPVTRAQGGQGWHVYARLGEKARSFGAGLGAV